MDLGAFTASGKKEKDNGTRRTATYNVTPRQRYIN